MARAPHAPGGVYSGGVDGGRVVSGGSGTPRGGAGEGTGRYLRTGASRVDAARAARGRPRPQRDRGGAGGLAPRRAGDRVALRGGSRRGVGGPAAPRGLAAQGGTVGSVVLAVAFAIPHLGWVVAFAVTTWGLGTVLLAVVEHVRRIPPPPSGAPTPPVRPS